MIWLWLYIVGVIACGLTYGFRCKPPLIRIEYLHAFLAAATWPVMLLWGVACFFGALAEGCVIARRKRGA